MSVAWLAGGAVAGLIIGSFLATLIVRWPDQRSMSGRSACDVCGVPVGIYDLVPLVSYVFLRGKCRHCGAHIAWVHPVVEALCMIVGAVALAIAPGADGIAGALFGWLLTALAILDLRHFWLPDALTATLVVLGVCAAFAGLPPVPIDRLIGGLVGFTVLTLVAISYRFLRGSEGIGVGDAKLFGAIGIWFGWQALPFVLLIASGIGLGLAIAMKSRGMAVTATTRLPLGTLLAAAGGLWWVVSRAG